MESQLSKLTYKPFKYPPDFGLARIHQRASMPGKIDPLLQTCPCCQQKVKIPFKSWWDRSIQKDFKDYGGAIVSYFWLLKLYSWSLVAIIAIYAVYLQYLTNYYCSSLDDPNLKGQICSNLFGVWIITNEDLYDLMTRNNDDNVIVRFFTLRSIVFLLLLMTNVASMYIMKWFKIRYPDKLDVSSFSLLFKNLRGDRQSELIDKLRQQFGSFETRQAFLIKMVEPFYSSYQKKLQVYYACKIESNQKKLPKMIQKLAKLDQFCTQNQNQFYDKGQRIIIMFNSIDTRNQIYAKWSATRLDKIKMFFDNKFQEEHGIYCEECPRPQQIIWHNIGKIQRQGFKVKILSVVYFFLILGFIFTFMYFLLEVVYITNIIEPWRTIIQNFILLFIVAVALTYRQLMNRLSQMRFPNTFTSRTMFIVITTVLFHFLFYLFVPSLYLRLDHNLRGAVLNLISNQSITFIIVQIILAGFDLMYCCWNRSRNKIEDEDRPIGCQKLLHQKIQYPRFPIEFKLIILFKIWSFITFFAFHVPMVLFLILVVLVFLFIKDKMNLYYHYRMEIIDNQVQFNFLRIYSNIFSLYMFITFIYTQHHPIQYIAGGVITLFTIFVQTIYFRKFKDNDSSRDSVAPQTLDQLDLHLSQSSYRQRYQQFIEVARSESVDIQIKQFLSKQGFGTMQTQEDLKEPLI